MKAVIADTSCLILFDKIQAFNVLRQVFSDIMITEEVHSEFGEVPDWIEITSVSNQQLYTSLAESLGKGEASAIVLSLELENSLLVIDERKGRLRAKQLDIATIGSLGILLKAKQKGIISSVSDYLIKIDETNFRISEKVRTEFLIKAQEL